VNEGLLARCSGTYFLTLILYFTKINFLIKEFKSMHIKVNHKMVEIFSGARVQDVLRKYSARTWKQVQQGSLTVCDGHGHEVGLEGELGDGDRLVVKRAAGKETRS
jgi:hypothetical protein